MKEQKGELNDILTSRQVVYKRVKIAMPHCPVCDQMLTGNNSSFMPYRCLCGTWESNWMTPGYYKIKLNAQ